MKRERKTFKSFKTLSTELEIRQSPLIFFAQCYLGCPTLFFRWQRGNLLILLQVSTNRQGKKSLLINYKNFHKSCKTYVTLNEPQLQNHPMPREFCTEPGITNKLRAMVISDFGMAITISYLAKPTWRNLQTGVCFVIM